MFYNYEKKIENMKVPRQTSFDQKKNFDFLLKKTRKNDTKCVCHNIDVWSTKEQRTIVAIVTLLISFKTTPL